MEQGFTKFLISFLEKETNLKKKDAINSMVFYWLPMLIGRILSSYLTINCFKAHIMLIISLILSLLFYCLWIYFLWKTELTRLLIYVLVTGNGLSISAISPTFIGWIKQFLSLSPIELASILIANALGGTCIGLLSGYVFEHYDFKHLFTLLIVEMALCLLFFALAFLFQRFHQKKQDKRRRTNEQEPTLDRFLSHGDKEQELSWN